MKTVEINNDLITWAISRAGYEPQNFFSRFPKAKEWLEDKTDPTIPQLKTFAKKVHLPFGYLFLNQPPEEELPIPFYRTLNGNTDEVSLNVRDSIVTLQKRQDWLRDYLKDNEYDPLEFVGKFTGRANKEHIIKGIRETLGLNEDWADKVTNWQDALNHLAKKIEEAGVIVVFNGVVENNTHRPISVEECRGFVLVDEYAPFMFVNAADSKAAQLFTIVHELAHIWIGKSAGFDFRQLHPSDNDIERFCDQVAAEFLVPENAFNHAWKQHQDFKWLAKQFKVSQIVVVRRALDLGKINRNEFFEFYDNHIKQYYHKKEKQDSGGNFYATLRKRLNLRFLATVNHAVKEHKLLYMDAYELTGLKGRTYQKAMNEYQL